MRKEKRERKRRIDATIDESVEEWTRRKIRQDPNWSRSEIINQTLRFLMEMDLGIINNSEEQELIKKIQDKQEEVQRLSEEVAEHRLALSILQKQREAEQAKVSEEKKLVSLKNNQAAVLFAQDRGLRILRGELDFFACLRAFKVEVGLQNLEPAEFKAFLQEQVEVVS